MRQTVTDLEHMRRAGRLAARVLDFITPYVKEGVTTDELDALCDKFTIENNAISAPLNYKGFPKSICTSINHVVCHGIPSDKKLKDKDILNIDITVILDGWYGDTSRMFYIGKPTVKAKRLVEGTYEAMLLGIEQVKPGNTVGDIGHAIETYANSKRFGVVREYCGHGIGQIFHDDNLQIPHFGEPDEGKTLMPGMFFTIEPMLNAGKAPTKVLDDNWTVVTRDRSLSAQWEHTVAVIEHGVEILTLSE